VLLAGDESDFRRFFDDYFPRLYRFAIERLAGDQNATQEIVQSTLSKTMLNIDKYRAESSLFTWMCSICKNEIFDLQKRQAREEQVLVSGGDITDLELASQSAENLSPDQPDDIYNRDQATQMIHKILDSLPAPYGNVIEWKYIEGLSLNQIAERLNMSHSATQSILFRARQAFQEQHGELTLTDKSTARQRSRNRD